MDIIRYQSRLTVFYYLRVIELLSSSTWWCIFNGYSVFLKTSFVCLSVFMSCLKSNISRKISSFLPLITIFPICNLIELTVNFTQFKLYFTNKTNWIVFNTKMSHKIPNHSTTSIDHSVVAFPLLLMKSLSSLKKQINSLPKNMFSFKSKS